jgi:predicted NBD/HSP70 family sugar kinase
MRPNPPIPGHELISEGHITVRANGTVYGGCRCGERPAGWETMSIAAVKRWHREHKDQLRGVGPPQLQNDELGTVASLLTAAAENLPFLTDDEKAVVRRVWHLVLIGGRTDLELIEGWVWCDYEGGVHADEADPYGMGPCEGPHRKLWMLTEEASA